MDDVVKTGIGAEKTDAVISTVVTKPVWHLVPLPLSQINPSACKPLSIRGQIPSLRSSCLAVISRNLHLYTVDQFQAIPKVIIRRIISRIRNDRMYEDGFERAYTSRNPDEGTIWCLSALLDPESTDDFQLALPQDSMLQYLTPNNLSKYPQHPLVELPTLYKTLSPHSSVSLLTTLTLDGMDGVVTDQNIQSLKYCTNLTGLWMKACKVTDTGIKLLTSSLQLPGDMGDESGRGLWKLRNWSLGGCRGVSDRSMKSFPRYPGLVMLDIRDTSCTTSAIDIFNRTCQNIFQGYNPDFQPCTEGLLDLFYRSYTSSETIDKLCLTLIKLPENTSSDKSHISLNIIPSFRPIEDRYLPESSTHTPTEKAWENKWDPAQKTVYRGNGIGQIYGTSVSRVADEVEDFRKRRKIAIEMEGKESELDRYANMSTNEKRNYTRQKNKEEKEWREARYHWKTKDKDEIKPKPKIYKGRGKKGDAERSKSFVMGTKGEQLLIDKSSKDDKSLMLVRMVNDNWDRLTWTLNAGSNDVSRQDKNVGIGYELAKTSFSQKVKATNLVEELLGTTMSAVTSSQIPNSQTTPSNPFMSTPLKQTSNRPSISVSPSPINGCSQTPQPQRDRNPFSSQSPKSNSMGVRPLSSPAISQSVKPLARSTLLNSSPFSFSQHTQLDIKPFANTQNSPKRNSTAGDGIAASKSKDDLSFSFSNNTRKRTFDGSGSGVGAKRGGMKMFSIASQKK
ncbi:hypothetical protein I204_01093 [Kwoniella mangroviensis CBS 8886]|nr:hypothetical protein I204_01093 [Kwoniella mangroviensis CBS 8886]